MEDNGVDSAAALLEPPKPQHHHEENKKGGGGGGGLVARALEENRKMWKIAFPSILFRVTSFGIFVVTQSFIGHIDKVDLAAYALVQTISMRFIQGITLGMSSATETLCGQAFGAKQYHMMGNYLQGSWIVDIVVVTVFIPFFIFGGPIYKLLGEADDVSEAAGSISLWFIPMAYSSLFLMTIQMFLQAQLKNMIVGWISATNFLVHVMLTWLFVSVLNWGVPGAMVSMNIARWSMVLGEWIYVFGGWCPDSWKGFSMQAFKDLGPLVKLSLSSGLMLCLEQWYTSVLVLLAGYSNDAAVDISAFSISLNINTWISMVFFGFMSSSCVRISNELGSGNAEGAKFSTTFISSISSALGVLLWIVFLVFGRDIPYLFTNDQDVAEAAADLSVLLAFTILLSCIQAVLSGVAIGSGTQARVAIINLCSYYVIGIPLGAVLAYVSDLGVKGIWIGMICGMAVQVLVLGYLTWTVDWNEQVNKAKSRLNQFISNPSEESSQSSSRQ